MRQLLGAGGKQAVRGAFEKQKRRPRLELRILLQQLAIARLERPEVLLLFLGELLEDAAAAGVARHARGARVELEPAAFGRDRDAQRVAREQQLGRRRLRPPARRPVRQRLAGAVNLQHALPRREAARRRDFLDQRLDVGAEELERVVAALADQMKVARMPVGVLEAEAAFAEIDLPRDARVDHPLQGAVDRRAADPADPRGGSGRRDRPR